ncbi:hypothetical protein FS749_010982 [Ceratobasidium sp. UAMH 11750]|nr:hypothetical protein FS749_010982 [Ceratobasidium sp. UAMH 11750]
MSNPTPELSATPSNMKLVPYTRPSREFRVSSARAASVNATNVPTHVPTNEREVRIKFQLIPLDAPTNDVVNKAGPMAWIKWLFNLIKRALVTFFWFVVAGFCITHPQSFDILLRLIVALTVIFLHAGGTIVGVLTECADEFADLIDGLLCGV